MIKYKPIKHMKECKIHLKLRRGLPLEDREVKLLGNIIREELKFLLRNNILPTPKNYERWFFVFCHYLEEGRLPSDAELIEVYHELYKDEKVSEVKFDLETTLEVVARLVEDFHKLIKEQGEFVKVKEAELSSLETEALKTELAPILMELLMHIKDIKAQNQAFLRKIEEQQKTIKELKTKLEKAETEANLDYLTNTFNRRSFERALKEAFEEYRMGASPFALIFLDIDGFKFINDTYGHSVGDIILKRVAYALRQNLRARDILARWGGDEFAVLMPGADKGTAVKVAERLREAVEAMEIKYEGKSLSISLSYGAVHVQEGFNSVEEMVKEADRLMYEYKKKKKG